MGHSKEDISGCILGRCKQKYRGVEAFKKTLGCDIIVDENGHLMGAFGVAILAKKVVHVK